MKKIFSLLAAVLFAGSMMAKEYTLTITPDDFPGNSYATNNGTHQKDAVAADESTVEVEFTTNQVMKQNNLIQGQKNTGYIKNESSWGEIKSITINGNVNFDYTTNEGLFEINAGSATSKASSIVIVFEQGESTEPAIAAKPMDFGKVVIAEDVENYVLDTTLAVTGVNLTEAIVATGSAHVTVSGSLTAEGGSLNLHIVAAPGEFSEVITLTSGATVKEVIVSGKVVQAAILPGTAAEMEASSDTKSLVASVNGIPGVKAGTGSASGSLNVIVPANAVKLHFYAVAWNNAPGDISASATPAGVTLSASEFTLQADPGISGMSTDYILSDLEPAECRFDIDLSGVTAETKITFASGTAQRFVVWGATYELAGPATAIENTAVEAKAIKRFVNGQLVIEKAGVLYNAQGAVIK
jgi:hypothetical protein